MRLHVRSCDISVAQPVIGNPIRRAATHLNYLSRIHTDNGGNLTGNSIRD
jgi:hypothetical protein